MRYSPCLILAAAAAITLSCAKENAPEPAAAEKVTIKVSFPEATRVALAETADRKAMHLSLEEGDILSVNGNTFNLVNLISDHDAVFEGTVPSGNSYTIIYPGKYASADAFNARSYAAQEQTGNSSMAHLEYNAMLSGVSSYGEPCFEAGWAAGKGGSLAQNGVLQLRLQLPAGVTTVTSLALIASRAVFPATNGGGERMKEQTLTLSGCTLPSNRILEAYMMFGAAGVSWQAGDRLTLAVGTPDAMYLRSLGMTGQTWAGGGQYTVQCKVETSNNYGIESVEDLLDFRDGVNSGSFLWQWCHVSLEDDLDLSDVGPSWTPIGNGSFNYSGEDAYAVRGNSFRGTFDGKGHVLRNFRMTGTPEANAPYGFFGILNGATVKNLVFGAAEGDAGYFKVTPSGALEAGIVAGVCRGSVLQDITNYSPMSIEQNSSSAPAFFGMVGYAMGTVAGGTFLDNVDNYGAVNVHGGSNTNNGGTGFNVAAIAGFSHTDSDVVRNRLDHCDNYAAVTTTTGRAAGILGAANSRTTLSACTNRGDIMDRFSGNARVAGIVSLLGSASFLHDCSNYGVVAATASGANAGGLACLLNNDSVEISGGGNHGLVVCDHAYTGTVAANFSSFHSVHDVTAGGAVARYNGGDYQYTTLSEANYLNHIGNLSAANRDKVFHVAFEAWDGYPQGNVTYIANAAQLVAFAQQVNAGTFAASDKAVLTADIDCSSIANWTPIGQVTAPWNSSYKPVISAGNAFTGTFDGAGHKIRNLHLTDAGTVAGQHFGLFGYIGGGATIENLVLDESCSLTVTSSDSHSAGMLVGVACDATIRHITSHASLNYQGGASGFFHMALIGGLYADASDCEVSDVHNYGAINAANTANLNAGITALHVAGIVGFANANSKKNNITSCTNSGDMTSQAGRTAGILGAANRNTALKDCINYGNQLNTMPKSDGSRLGNICCLSQNGSSVTHCINYGDLVSTNNGRVGGIISLCNAGTYQNNENYGEIISDSQFRGVLFSNIGNGQAAAWSGGIASGKLGQYNGGSYAYDSYDEANKNKYLGKDGSGGKATFSGITYAMDASGTHGISSAADLLAFATAFNSGASVAKYLVNGEVTLNNDINAASITQWVPIGTNSRPLTYNINGNGKAIVNVNWTVNVSSAESVGLIGCADGISIRNLTLGSPSGSEIVFTGNRSKVRAGGIVGRAQSVTMENVVNNASLRVTGTQATGNNLILGGLAGYSDVPSVIGGDSDEKGCTNNGDVSAGVAAQLGGLAGYNSGIISHCTNNGTISCPTSGSYGPGWLCSHNTTKSKLTDNRGYGRVGDSPAHIKNAVMDYESSLDPLSVTVDWTLDSYYDWNEVETRNLHSGAVYHHYSCTHVPREVFVLEVDLTDPGIELTSALAGEMVPNPNGLLNSDYNNGFHIRERLSDVCKRRRAAGQNILAGMNAGFFDTHEGILRGFHVENGEPLYINSPDVVTRLVNHRWGFTVFADGTASCGVKQFSGRIRTNGKEYEYYSINDTLLRRPSADYPINLYTARYKKQPYSDHSELVNTLAAKALYVICEWDQDPMTVNTGYARATVKGIRDARKGATPPYLSSDRRFVISLTGKKADEWSRFIAEGQKVEVNCTISVDGVTKPIRTQCSTMYQLMTDGRDASDMPSATSTLQKQNDPMTFPVVSKDGTKVWLVEIDGRQGWYSIGVKSYEIYRIAQKLGGWWVTRFDGGGSSCTWVWNASSGSGGLVNRPSDSNGERSCLSYLLLRAK